jgi:hypothetical protein
MGFCPELEITGAPGYLSSRGAKLDIWVIRRNLQKKEEKRKKE